MNDERDKTKMILSVFTEIFDESSTQWKLSTERKCVKSNILLWKLLRKLSISCERWCFGKLFLLDTDISMKAYIAKISSHFQVVHFQLEKSFWIFPHPEKREETFSLTLPVLNISFLRWKYEHLLLAGKSFIWLFNLCFTRNFYYSSHMHEELCLCFVAKYFMSMEKISTSNKKEWSKYYEIFNESSKLHRKLLQRMEY